MHRFKNILIVYSQRIGDEAALHRAAILAKLNGARLTVLEVIEKVPHHATALFGSTIAEQRDMERQFFEERQALLNRVIASVRQNGIDVCASIRHGPPFLEIVRAVLRERHDLVILSADGWQGLRSIAFGSTSMHVMRKCPCPVWVIKPAAQRQFHRILAAVNPGVAESAPDVLDLKIIQLASSLARMEGCRLDILNVWDFIGADLDTSRSEITEEIRSRLIDKYSSAHKAAVNRLLERIDLEAVKVDVHLPNGDPRTVIPQVVEERKVDLIVMGTVTRTGIAGFLIGATAEDVLRQVDCSVLTVKPDGFVSPVMAVD